LIEIKYENKNFTLLEISQILLFVYITSEYNFYLIIELAFGFTYILYLQYEKKIENEFLLGNIIGAFFELSNIETNTLIKINKIILTINKNLFFDFSFKFFISNSNFNFSMLKNSLSYFISQFSLISSIDKKALIFRGIFKPPVKKRDLIEFLIQMESEENNKVVKNNLIQLNNNENILNIIDAFLFCFFIPFIENMNFNADEKSLFFDRWDTRGFFRYFLFSMNYLNFLKIGIDFNSNSAKKVFFEEKIMKHEELLLIEDNINLSEAFYIIE